MMKKSILLYILLHTLSFAKYEDIIQAVPRKEQAYLDIEITKLNTRTLRPLSFNTASKTIIVPDISLTSSQILLLGENPDLFGALYSVNNKLPALKDIAFQTNLSYSQLDGERVAITYQEVPSLIYAAIWNRSERVVEKIYEIDLSNPISSSTMQFYPANSFTYDKSKSPMEIELGTIYDKNGGGTLSYKFSSSTLTWKNYNEELSGYLYFKFPDGSTVTSFDASNYDELSNIKVVLQFPSFNDIKRYAQGSSKVSIKVPRELEIVPISTSSSRAKSRMVAASSTANSVAVGETLQNIPMLFSSTASALKISCDNLDGSSLTSDTLTIVHGDLERGKDSSKTVNLLLSRQDSADVLTTSVDNIKLSWSSTDSTQTSDQSITLSNGGSVKIPAILSLSRSSSLESGNTGFQFSITSLIRHENFDNIAGGSYSTDLTGGVGATLYITID
jgi:hypothetical protein